MKLTVSKIVGIYDGQLTLSNMMEY